MFACVSSFNGINLMNAYGFTYALIFITGTFLFSYVLIILFYVQVSIHCSAFQFFLSNECAKQAILHFSVLWYAVPSYAFTNL